MAFCPNCGSAYEEGTKFCGSCGSALPVFQTVPQSVQQPIQPVYQNTVQPEVQQQAQPVYQQPPVMSLLNIPRVIMYLMRWSGIHSVLAEHSDDRMSLRAAAL